MNGSDPKYGASLIVSKKDAKTITAIQKAIEQAKKDSVGKWGGKVPSNLKTPLRDGEYLGSEPFTLIGSNRWA